MTVDESMREAWLEMSHKAALNRPDPELPLKGGSGDGTSGGMEGRVARLEAHMEVVRADLTALKADVGAIKTDLATLKERVSHLPGKGFVVGATMSGLALFGGLAVFADNIRALIGG